MNDTVRVYPFAITIVAALLVATIVLPTTAAAATDIALHFSDRATVIERDCTATVVMRRSYSVKQVKADFLLSELLTGPSEKEQLAGAADSFAPLLGGDDEDSRLVKYLVRAEQTKGRIEIHFSGPAIAWFNNGSCGAATVWSPIQATLLQLNGIKAVQIYIEGDRLQDVMEEVGDDS